jgi:hypothetical protein
LGGGSDERNDYFIIIVVAVGLPFFSERLQTITTKKQQKATITAR